MATVRMRIGNTAPELQTRAYDQWLEVRALIDRGSRSREVVEAQRQVSDAYRSIRIALRIETKPT